MSFLEALANALLLGGVFVTTFLVLYLIIKQFF